jgi:glucose/arabinose dehydrogenase
MRFPVLAFILSTGLLCAQAKKPARKVTAKPLVEAPGRWIMGTIGVGKGADGAIEATAYKGIALRLGDKGEASIAYDTRLGRVLGGWSGKFTTEMNLMSRGEYPTAMGPHYFITGEVAGYAVGEAASAFPSAPGFAALPPSAFKLRSFEPKDGDGALTFATAAGDKVTERPGTVEHNEARLIVRRVTAATSKGVTIALCRSSDAARVAVRGPGRADTLEGQAVWRVPPGQAEIEIAYAPPLAAKPEGWPTPEATVRRGREWAEDVVTAGEPSANKDAAYVLDRIKLPEENPWKAPMFTSALDFLPGGAIAVSTFHGDVWTASGVDATLAKVTWRRHAAGLYHALGLKVVNGDVLVTCRDGVWRLIDRDKDGEADAYEAFNLDLMVTKNFHEFVFDLQQDPAGNLYFIKAGPVRNGGRGFDEICDHHGALLRLPPDGSRLEVVATGFRAPNGIGVGPDGQITTGDNEGTWTPVCRLNWIKQGGFYGVVDLAHRQTPPADYDRPLCWFPKDVDNSSGGQVWVTSDKWGPWSGRLLHLSYGTCSIFGVLPQKLEGVPLAPIQGGVARFDFTFDSGAMRARFSPADGQLYVTGLRGWQTTATRNGALQRVRYTGAPVRMPLALTAVKGGLRVEFAEPVDPKVAADPAAWNLEVWNYVWSSAYGSPDVSTLAPPAQATTLGNDGKMQFSKEQMSERKHDPLAVRSVKVVDGRTVVLDIPELRPAMQTQLKYDLKSADGKELRGQIIGTIHALPE